MDIKPDKLRKTTDGRIFNFSEALARRKDMEPFWPGDIDPNKPVQHNGLNTEDVRCKHLEEEISARDEQLKAKDRIISRQSDEIDRLKQELQKALSQVNAQAEAVNRAK